MTSGFFLSRYCHNIAESDVKQYSRTHSLILNHLTVYYIQTQDVDPIPIYCRPIVFDVGPPLNQHWVNVCVCLILIEVVTKHSSRTDLKSKHFSRDILTVFIIFTVMFFL